MSESVRNVLTPSSRDIVAGISSVTQDAAAEGDTDWNQVLALYDQPLALTPTPIVALNRAVAVAEVQYHGTRADLLARLDRCLDARAAYDRAYVLTTSTAEKRFLDEKRRAV